MRAQFGVVADDLTGANDTGVQFKKCGMETIVLIDINNIKNVISIAEVIVIDTESRNDAPELAYKKVKEAAKALKTAEIKLIYKKIDSTLRGNIGSELDAVMDELGIHLSIVAPAFPANGRITVGGYHFVNLAPVEKTEFAHDPVSPVKESHVPTLIQRQSQRNVGHINLSIVMDGLEPFKQEIYRQREKGKEIIVIDAATQNDLKTIAKAIVDVDALACGSAGLAEELSRALKHPRRGSVIVVSGSISNATMQQTSRAREVLNPNIVEPDLYAILKGGEAKEKELHKVTREVREAIGQSRDVIIRSAKSKEHVTESLQVGRKLGMSDVEVGERILLFLTEVFIFVAEGHTFAGLVLIGGDTAIRIIKAIKALGTRIEDEVLPGIPACKLIGGKYDGLRIVTKAGGFGDENAVINAIKYLKRGG